MNSEIKALWVAALRGGSYKQGTGKLCDSKMNYCCLGVLCDVVKDMLPVKMVVSEGWYCTIFNGSVDLLPNAVCDTYEITRSGIIPTTKFNGGKYETLDSLNDAGMTFPDIADIIEKHF